MFMPICTDTALPSTLTTVLAFMYQPKLPVENCFTSASISWPLITIFSGSAFSRNCVRDTGQEVLGGMGLHSHRKPAGRATGGPPDLSGRSAWARPRSAASRVPPAPPAGLARRSRAPQLGQLEREVRERGDHERVIDGRRAASRARRAAAAPR